MLTGSPSASLTSRRWPSAPVQLVLARVLEAGQPHVVGADHAEHLRGEVALRVGALGLDHRADPLDAEVLDLLAERGVHLAPQVDEARRRDRDSFSSSSLSAAADQRREALRHAGRIVDQERDGRTP